MATTGECVKGLIGYLSPSNTHPGITAKDGEFGFGGQGGIRTHGTLARTPHFECGAFNHSTTCPPAVIWEQGRERKPFYMFSFLRLRFS